MVRGWITSDQGQQPALLPVEVRALLPADHRAFDILALVDELDLSLFIAAYRADRRGRPPFHPAMMLALILYCRSKRLMSSRDIAAACHDDLGARMITGNRYPDRSTIDTFITRHAAPIAALLAQTLRIGHGEDLLDVSLVAGDGTKALANAAMGATVDEAGLVAQITDLRQQLEDAHTVWLQQVSGDTTQHPATLFGDTDTEAPSPAPGQKPTAAWRRVRTLSTLLHSRQAALAYLHAHPNTAYKDWAQRLERDRQRVQRRRERLEQTYATLAARYERYQDAKANGHTIPRTPPVPAENHVFVRKDRKALAVAVGRAEATAANPPTTTRVNTTDPASQIMPGKHDGYDQRHNIQALACKNQFIIAIGTHHNSTDKQALTALIRNGRANLDAAAITDPIGVALFDNGYASEANFTTELPIDLLLIAVEKEARQTERLQDGTTTAKQAWQQMADRFDDPNNRALYKRRAAIIEPVFAQLFARFGRNLNTRGDIAVNTELHLWAVTHNLIKISRHRRREHPPG